MSTSFSSEKWTMALAFVALVAAVVMFCLAKWIAGGVLVGLAAFVALSSRLLEMCKVNVQIEEKTEKVPEA